MAKSLYRSLILTIGLLLIVSGLYPALVTGLGSLLFASKAEGGLIKKGDTVIGAELIGQSFTQPKYIHGRPSAAGDKGYDATSSSGSNLGPTNKKLIDRINTDVARIRSENPTMVGVPVPVDLATASASGLDPHLSPAGAKYQAARVAAARNVPVDAVNKLIDELTEGPALGFLGQPVVNVLRLNQELDSRLGPKEP